jgi:lysophospholipid acyltransferase (LPLAT)-like uncharacterized protein
VPLVKRLTRSERVREALCWLGAQYIRLVHGSGDWRVEGGDIPAGFWERGEPFILAFWHGRIMMMPYCWPRDKKIDMLISQHRDGQFIARTVSHFGIDTVAGSSSKGGTAALRSMLRALKSGNWVGITPDGPRGPRMRAADGVVQVARLSGVPVIACGFSARRRTLLNSWDHFTVALPFSQGIFVWGEPIHVAADASADALEQARRAVEDSLTRVTQAADRAMGHQPVEPAP